MKKNFLKTLICLFTLFLVSSSLVVNAKKIEIKEEENPTGQTVLTIDNEKVYIEIDETTGVSYVCLETNGLVSVLGTCEVVLVDRENPEGLVFGNADSNMVSYGSITIIVLEDTAIVLELEGTLENYFVVDAEVVVSN